MKMVVSGYFESQVAELNVNLDTSLTPEAVAAFSLLHHPKSWKPSQPLKGGVGEGLLVFLK